MKVDGTYYRHCMGSDGGERRLEGSFKEGKGGGGYRGPAGDGCPCL